MPSSLVKFAHRQDGGDGRKLFWQRSDVDGLPYRGSHAPIMPDEEYEARTVRVADPRNGFFDVANEKENKQFLAVLDGVCNGWFKLVYIERFHNGTTKHYVEWVEYYMEDGTRTPFSSTQGMMELTHGTGNFPFNSQQG